MQIAPETVEGTWEEISHLAPKFNGHRLRVTILPDEPLAGGPPDAVVLTPHAKSVIARLRARIIDEATDDPEEIRLAQEEFDEMKKSMNAERLRSGAEPIF